MKSFHQAFVRRLSHALLLAAFAVAAQASGATLLSVDLGSGAAEGTFTAWNIGVDGNGPPRTRTFAVTDPAVAAPLGITATVASGTSITDMSLNTAGLNTRNRVPSPADAGAFTYNDLLSDRVVALTSVDFPSIGLFLELTGFTPGAVLSIQVWGFDAMANGTAKPGNFALRNRTGGGDVLLGSFTTVSGALPVDNNSFSVTGTVTADATGKVVLQSVSNIDGVGIMNGFRISSVPEPSIGILMFGGMGFVLCVTRRRPKRAC